MTWMVYGANGYTGRLVARLAADLGDRLEPPVLAGRSPGVRDLARELGLEARVVDLADGPGLDRALSDVDLVLHCAGPFALTSRPMVEACLRAGAAYLDITGEPHVFETVYAEHDRAVAAGVALVPGVGFDVVPSDHLLATLHEQLPTAVRADVVLVSRGGFSRGTLRTVLDGMREGGLVRRDGALVVEPMARDRLRVTGDGTSLVAASVPLGDVASGFRATGIPRITDYSALPAARLVASTTGPARRLLASDRVAALADRALAAIVRGPSEETRARTRSDVVVRLTDVDGDERTAAIGVANTYDFTARSALHAVERVRSGGVAAGAWAPSQALGRDFCREVPDGEVVDLELRLSPT